MFLTCFCIGLMAVLVLVQMLVPRQSLTALGAVGCGGCGLYFAFNAGLWTGVAAVSAVLLVLPLAVYLSLLIMAPNEPQIRPDDVEYDPAARQAEREALVGLAGMAQTPVDPTGMAFLNGKRVQVISESGPLPHGAAVVVEKVAGYRVVVRAKT